MHGMQVNRMCVDGGIDQFPHLSRSQCGIFGDWIHERFAIQEHLVLNAIRAHDLVERQPARLDAGFLVDSLHFGEGGWNGVAPQAIGWEWMYPELHYHMGN